jgi:hypothetical protein
MSARIKKILMKRDGISEQEAEELIAETADSIEAVVMEGGSLCEAEDIVMDDLGLEPDYMEDFLMAMV